MGPAEQPHGILQREVRYVKGVGPKRAALLARLGLRTVEDLTFHRSALERAHELLVDYLQQHGQITVATFRSLIASTRKYALPLLGYFDSIGVTRRRGDERVLGPRWGRSPHR